jgi:hypothetical protein
MTSWSGDDHGFGLELRSEQDPEFKDNFPVQGKRYFKSMCEVRSYAPMQTVQWPRCSHNEFCVMQIYQGWNNSGHRFWLCPQAWVRNVHDICSTSFIGLLTFSLLLQYSNQPGNYGFSQSVDPKAIDPYQRYINYLEEVVIYNLKRELEATLSSPDPSSSAGDDRCCTCSTCTWGCHKKISSPPRMVPPPSPPPPTRYYYVSSQQSGGSMFSGQYLYN